MMGTFYQPSRYWGKIVDHQMTKAKTGTPQFVITFLVVGRVNPEDPDGDLLGVEQQYERSVYRSITDKTVSYVLEDLQRLGVEIASWSELDMGDANAVALKGRELAFSCQHEPDQSGKQLREKWSIAGDGFQHVPLERDDVRKLDALFGKALTKAKAGRTAPALEPPVDAPFAPQPAEVARPDDIPF